MVLSTDEIKQEKEIEMDLNPQPCSRNTASAPEDLSMRATGDGQATKGGVRAVDRTADEDRTQRPDQNTARKLTNFFIDDILRSDFGPKRCCSASITPLPSPVLSPLVRPRPLPLHLFASPVLSFSSPLAHSVTFTPTSSKLRRTDILTPPPSSPESSSSSSPRSSSSLSSPSSSISTPLSRRLLQSSKKEARSSSGPAQDSGSKFLSQATHSSNPSLPGQLPQLPLPAWVYCTRYSDRPSSGPRFRKPRQSKASTDKRPRTAFSSSQLQRLRTEFQDCPYLSEARRLALADELGLSESQIKIWFQNKRAKLKKGCGMRNPLAQLLMEEGLYNHSTVVVREDNDDSVHHGDQNNSDNN